MSRAALEGTQSDQKEGQVSKRRGGPCSDRPNPNPQLTSPPLPFPPLPSSPRFWLYDNRNELPESHRVLEICDRVKGALGPDTGGWVGDAAPSFWLRF